MAHPPDICVHDLPSAARQELLAKAAEVVGRHPEVLFCYAHGSFLNPGPFRDLDLAVYLSDPVPHSRFAYEDALETELAETLRAGFAVDVRIGNGSPLAFQHHAYQGQLLLDRKPEHRAAVLSHVASRYLDIKPILEHHAREAFGHGPRS